jgi:FtsZ-interacting cell division protein ZipA
MDAAVIIAIVATLLVLIGLMVWGARRRSAAVEEQKRYRAAQTRDLAQVAEAEADQRAAEATERAARAERERLVAEQQRLEAEQQRQDAAALHQQADEIDPDVEIDLDGEDTNRDAPPEDDLQTVDLREAHATRDAAARPPDEPRER